MLTRISVVLLLIVGLCNASTAFAKEVSWRYYGLVPATHGFAKQLQKTFDRISTSTKGEFKVRYVFYGETPYKAADALAIVRDGQVEMSDWLAAYSTATYPILAGPELPFLFSKPLSTQDALSTAKVLWGTPGMTAALDKMLDGFNGLVLAKYFYEPTNIWLAKPVSNMDGLRGLKIRVFSPALTDIMSAAGAEPLLMPLPDVYPALQRGIISGVTAGISSMRGAKWNEVLKAGYEVNMAVSLAAAVANKKAVGSLSPEHRAVLQAEMKRYADGMAAYVVEVVKEERAALEKGGFKIVDVTAKDYAKLRDLASKQVWPKWSQKVGEQSAPVLKELLGVVSAR